MDTADRSVGFLGLGFAALALILASPWLLYTYEVTGKPFYWGPGHAPIALEDSEYVDFSPTEELATVIRHIKGE